MHNAREIAEFFISLGSESEEGNPSNLKIQKLLYYAQGYALADFRSQIFPEKIIAWNLGPVVLEVYNRYKKHGYSPVPLPEDFALSKYDEGTQELLVEVFTDFGALTASDLVERTHSEPPWKMTRINGEIKLKHLQDYFSQIREARLTVS